MCVSVFFMPLCVNIESMRSIITSHEIDAIEGDLNINNSDDEVEAEDADQDMDALSLSSSILLTTFEKIKCFCFELCHKAFLLNKANATYPTYMLVDLVFLLACRSDIWFSLNTKDIKPRS